MFIFKYNGEQVYSTVKPTYFLNVYLFFATVYYDLLINCRYGSTITRVVPPETALSHCFVVIPTPMFVDAKFIAISCGLDGSEFEFP